jgi:hypothetical protein
MTGVHFHPRAWSRFFVVVEGETFEDVANALEDIARQVGQGRESGTITNAHGQAVGEWRPAA